MSERRAVVAAHGALAESLIEAVALITGRADRLHAVSNRGLDATGVAAAIEAALVETGAQQIFTDLPAGSCTMAARRVQHAHPGIDVVAGVNLPLLLDFVLSDTPGPLTATELADRARAHLRAWEGTHGD